jgi:hypothetical protein
MVGLNELHNQAQKAMEKVFQALWLAKGVPSSLAELADRLMGARCWIRTWKISACREGAREAWAMIKTRYCLLEMEKLAREGPKGPDGKEIRASMNYENVMPAARLSEKDCCLDTLIDGLE